MGAVVWLIISQLGKHKGMLFGPGRRKLTQTRVGENWIGKFKEKQDVDKLGRNPNVCISSSFMSLVFIILPSAYGYNFLPLSKSIPIWFWHEGEISYPIMKLKKLNFQCKIWEHSLKMIIPLVKLFLYFIYSFTQQIFE